MKIQRRLDRRALAPSPDRRRQCRGRPNAPRRREQRARTASRGCGVGDAHLADHEQIAILRHGAIADVDRAQEFIGIHGGCDREVARRRSSSIGTTASLHLQASRSG